METQNKEMSVKDWFITLLITALPLVGFIMLLVWAFGNNENQTRQNFAKGSLLLALLGLVLAVIFFVVFGSMFAAAAMANGGFE